ncbi:kinase-like domain-containing protein [Rhizophagus clarus]|uniref:Kinase-like domain-containing protein n=1 Tax=Rhizophagus clarus TaxID=94130 RepID=A0A8H3LBB6_9GLOM|nr:kinase-like domain-containing protein [Rhizophagus clarus]
MTTIRKKLIYAAIQEAFSEAEKNPNLNYDLINQQKLLNGIIFANKFLTTDEKTETIRIIAESYDYFKIIKDEDEKRICENCQSECLATSYCEICIRNYLKSHFSNWISDNDDIDNLIQKCQMETVAPTRIIEWILYNNLRNIKYLTEGGFSEIYTAKWIDGPYNKWNSKKQQLNKFGTIRVIFKKLENVENANRSWFEEAKSHLTISNKSSGVVKSFGLSIDPSDGNYMLVLQQVDIDLRRYLLQSHNKLTWKERINIICDIIKALYEIHKENAIHRDLHSGNILYLQSADLWCISDLGFFEPADKSLKSIYGNLPYIAPEAEKYLKSLFGRKVLKIYGISQNPNTNDYILVYSNSINLVEVQLRMNNYEDNIFEWISYNQFDEIKKLGKNSSNTMKDGPLHYNSKFNNFTRDLNKEIVLKDLHNSENPIDFLIKEAKKYSTKIFGRKMQLKINDYDDIVFEWIQYNQFDDIKEIGKGGFSTVYSAKWKDGPLVYNVNEKIYNRDSNKVIALKCLHNSQNVTSKVLDEVKEYSINRRSNILNVYGISQNPITREYIIALNYAKEGNFNSWINENYKYFNWQDKLSALLNIITTGRQPFYNRAHDHELALDICKGVRPEINESEAPKCYIDLMKKCWDLNPNNRPYIDEVDELITSFHKSSGVDIFIVENEEIEMQFKEAEEYRKANLSCVKNYQAATHPQAIYTSRLLNPFTDYLDCLI